MKFKAGDTILVTAGKDKGKKGKIEKVLVQAGKVLVKGVNLYKRHVKPKGENQKGGIISLERPLPVANVALICSKCDKPTRAGYQVSKTGIKQRICRKCGGVL
mgnify:FL=1